MNNQKFLQSAREQAQISQQQGGIVAGAVLVKGQEIVASSQQRA